MYSRAHNDGSGNGVLSNLSNIVKRKYLYLGKPQRLASEHYGLQKIYVRGTHDFNYCSNFSSHSAQGCAF